MEYKYLILVGAIMLVSFAIFFILANPGILYSSSEMDDSCESIFFNGGPGEKVNIVFVGENIERDILESYSNSLLGFSPFLENKNKLNFFYVNEAVECEQKYSAILCYSRKLLKASSVCPNDFIVVLSDKPPFVRSSAYMNVISLNINLPMNVFAHEFGHVFARLADEYVPANIPSGSKNCQEDCVLFEKEGQECFEGCSNSNYFRSSKNSIMKSLNSDSFFYFNENILEEELNDY